MFSVPALPTDVVKIITPRGPTALFPTKRTHLHALYLLASDQAHSRQEVATLLGVDRNTVGRWLTIHRQSGLPALLTVYVPAGERKPLTPAQLQTLQQALAQPHGFTSFGAIQQYIVATFGVQSSYNATRKLVRYKLGAKLKVPRPSHQKKAEVVATFRATFADHLHACLPMRKTQPVEVWAMDESRVGLQTVRRRRITAHVPNPSAPISTRSATFICTARLRRVRGNAYFVGSPTLNAAQFQVFLDHFAAARPHTLNVLLIDNSRAHAAAALQRPPT